MALITLNLLVVLSSGLFFVNVYSSIVDARSWSSNIPDSVATARQYAKDFNAGTFFKLISPLSQILSVLALILFWKYSPIRLYLALVLASSVFSEIFTVLYFYPRNDIIFRTGALSDTEMISKALKEWNTMNWLRSLCMLIGVVFSLFALRECYRII
jgi:hypothetical protein